jgi:hypothetical protein
MACEITPPIEGPSTGAIKGIMPIMLKALPRCCSRNISPTIHGLITVEATERPRKNRILISMPKLLLLAATIFKTIKRIFAVW